MIDCLQASICRRPILPLMFLRNAVTVPPLIERNSILSCRVWWCPVWRAVSLHALFWPRVANMQPASTDWRCLGATIESKAPAHVDGVHLPNKQRNHFLRPDACADVRRRETTHHCAQMQQSLALLLHESPHPRRQRSTLRPPGKTPSDSQKKRTADNLKTGLPVRNLPPCMGLALKTDLAQRAHRSSHALQAPCRPTIRHPDAIAQHCLVTKRPHSANNNSTIVWSQQNLQQNSDDAGGIGLRLTQNDLDEFHVGESQWPMNGRVVRHSC